MDKYILRLSNSNNAVGVRNSPTFQTFSVDLPNGLKNKGKCIIRVVNSSMILERSINGEQKRIIPDNTHIIVLSSNISSLGYDTDTRGSSNTILGSGLVLSTQKAITLAAHNDSFHFMCPSLPDVIELTKLCVSPTTDKLILTNDTTASLYCSVTLEITFISDLTKN
jgi:hypothetical protein